MLKAEQQNDLIVRNAQGESIRSLSRATGLSRNTVRKYVRSRTPLARRKTSAKRPEKLDPFKPYILERLKIAAPRRVAAAVLFREISERGYLGGLTRVKEFIRDSSLAALAPASPAQAAASCKPTTRSAIAA
jgi:transposase